MSFSFQSRSTWGAGPTPSGDAPLDKGVVFHWNGPPMGSYARANVPAIIRSTRNYHVNTNGWADIAYNFSIDRFGTMWEGRGDYIRNAASGTSYANENYLAVEFLCGEGDPFTDAMKLTAKAVVEQYIKSGRERYCLGHKEVAGETACPGGEILSYVASLRDYMKTYNPNQSVVISNKGTGDMDHVMKIGQSYYACYGNGIYMPMSYEELQSAQARNIDQREMSPTGWEGVKKLGRVWGA